MLRLFDFLLFLSLALCFSAAASLLLVWFNGSIDWMNEGGWVGGWVGMGVWFLFFSP